MRGGWGGRAGAASILILTPESVDTEIDAMLHMLGWFAIALLCLFFTVSGFCMLLSPTTYFRWLSRLGPRSGRITERGTGRRWMAIELWTRIRGAILLAALGWVAYQGYLKFLRVR